MLIEIIEFVDSNTVIFACSVWRYRQYDYKVLIIKNLD